MLNNYKITYDTGFALKECVISATSKYDAKQRFYRKYPSYGVTRIEQGDGSEPSESRQKAEKLLEKLRTELERHIKRIPQRDGTLRIEPDSVIDINISRGFLRTMPEVQNENGEIEIFGFHCNVIEDNGIELRLTLHLK